jgi:hypothetical protein
MAGVAARRSIEKLRRLQPSVLQKFSLPLNSNSEKQNNETNVAIAVPAGVSKAVVLGQRLRRSEIRPGEPICERGA